MFDLTNKREAYDLHSGQVWFKPRTGLAALIFLEWMQNSRAIYNFLRPFWFHNSDNFTNLQFLKRLGTVLSFILCIMVQFS
jgi:hypothetical protein